MKLPSINGVRERKIEGGRDEGRGGEGRGERLHPSSSPLSSLRSGYLMGVGWGHGWCEALRRPLVGHLA